MAKRELKFSTTVDASALLQTNPKEFYTKALLENRSSAMFRQVLNIKEETKIGKLEFGNLLNEAGCDYVGGNQTLSAKTMNPCKIQLGTDVCMYELETSFLADWMKAGSNQADFMPAEFASFFYTELGREVSNQLEYLTWQGDTEAVTGTYLDLCDGLERKLCSAVIPDAQTIVGTIVTAANVIAQLTLMYNAIPKALKAQKNNVLWFVSTNIADAYRLAVAVQSAEMYTTKDAPLNFLGYTLTVGEGMSDNVSVLSLKDNYVFLADLVSDSSDLTTINMLNTTGDARIRVRGDFKVGFDFLNDTEWVTYGLTCLAS